MNEKTKFGQKRKTPKTYRMKRSKIKPVSDRRKKEQVVYQKLTNKLKYLSGGKSELSKQPATTFDWLENHHIDGRVGDKYLDPFNMIILLKSEHDEEEAHKSFERRQELLAFIKPIRIMQGFVPDDV